MRKGKGKRKRDIHGKEENSRTTRIRERRFRGRDREGARERAVVG